MQHPIDSIEGIGPASVALLRAAGIVTTADLLQKCATAHGRTDVGARTGLVEMQLLAWAGIADFMRVDGMEMEHAALLQAAGLHRIEDLATSDAAELTEALKRASEAKQLARALPGAETVAQWVRQAATLAPLISY